MLKWKWRVGIIREMLEVIASQEYLYTFPIYGIGIFEDKIHEIPLVAANYAFNITTIGYKKFERMNFGYAYLSIVPPKYLPGGTKEEAVELLKAEVTNILSVESKLFLEEKGVLTEEMSLEACPISGKLYNIPRFKVNKEKLEELMRSL